MVGVFHLREEVLVHWDVGVGGSGFSYCLLFSFLILICSLK